MALQAVTYIWLHIYCICCPSITQCKHFQPILCWLTGYVLPERTVSPECHQFLVDSYKFTQ
nr:unnamed protein product [Callosobruchus chinensis]